MGRMFQPFCAPFGAYQVSSQQSQVFLCDERSVETESFESFAPSGRGWPDRSLPGVKTPGPAAPSGRRATSELGAAPIGRSGLASSRGLLYALTLTWARGTIVCFEN